jgi:hypothetical protein
MKPKLFSPEVFPGKHIGAPSFIGQFAALCEAIGQVAEAESFEFPSLL